MSPPKTSERETDPVKRYSRCGLSIFSECGEDWQVRESRQRLFDLGFDNKEIRKLDEIVLESAIVNDYVSSSATQDDESQPLERWWWHLNKLRNETYPIELLPDYLKVVYKESQNS